MHDALPVCGRDRRSGLVDDAQCHGGRGRLVAFEQARHVAAGQVAHGQERSVRLAPEVVQRHRVGVFHAGDGLSVGVEAADERGAVRELAPHRLEGHDALDAGLRRAPHDRRPPGSDAFQQPVAAQGRRAPVEVVVAQDLLLQPDELRRRVDAQLLGQQVACLGEHCQRAGLAARPVQRHHQVRPEALVQRIRVRQRTQLTDQLTRATAGEVGGYAIVEHGQAQVGQAGGLSGERPLVGEVRERLAAPQPERRLQQPRRLGRVGGQQPPATGRELLELAPVDPRAVGDERVPLAATEDAIGPDDPPQVRHVAVQ